MDSIPARALMFLGAICFVAIFTTAPDVYIAIGSRADISPVPAAISHADGVRCYQRNASILSRSSAKKSYCKLYFIVSTTAAPLWTGRVEIADIEATPEQGRAALQDYSSGSFVNVYPTPRPGGLDHLSREALDLRRKRGGYDRIFLLLLSIAGLGGSIAGIYRISSGAKT